MVELGVNVDHVATLRQARRTYEPDPVAAAMMAELGGADGITVHLREDRRHIQVRDLEVLRKTVTVKLNLELACAAEVIEIACRVMPDQVTLVPERRTEVTTEGGLDVVGQSEHIGRAIQQLRAGGLYVSLFLDPDLAALDMAARLNAQAVELHTGQYALARGDHPRQKELDKLVTAAERVRQLGLGLHAGHGLNYKNVYPIATIPQMRELNIGHAIISRAVLVGLERAVREMKAAMAGVHSAS